MREVLAAWPVLVYSFHTELGVELEHAWFNRSWRWFRTRVNGLLSTDTPLSRYFAPEDEPQEAPSE